MVTENSAIRNIMHIQRRFVQVCKLQTDKFDCKIECELYTSDRVVQRRPFLNFCWVHVRSGLVHLLYMIRDVDFM